MHFFTSFGTNGNGSYIINIDWIYQHFIVFISRDLGFYHDWFLSCLILDILYSIFSYNKQFVICNPVLTSILHLLRNCTQLSTNITTNCVLCLHYQVIESDNLKWVTKISVPYAPYRILYPCLIHGFYMLYYNLWWRNRTVTDIGLQISK